MMENENSKEMRDKSLSSLEEIVKNTQDYTREEFLAAKTELERRRQFEHPETTGEYIEMIQEFPQKPADEVKQKSINRSLLSLALFIAAFYLIFKWDFTYILVLAGVIFIHELGHYFAMRVFKYRDLGIFFVPMVGAFATGTKENISQKQKVIVLLSGPLPGVIIGLILYYFGLLHHNEFLMRTSNIFILLNLFNLLPVMPLDGGRIVKSLFFENNEMISKMFIFISIALLTYYSFNSQSYFLLIIPFLLLIQLNMQSQVKKVRIGAEKRGINLDKSYNELSDKDYWLIREEIGAQMKYFERFIAPKRYVIADNEDKIVKQVKAIIQKKPTKDLKISGKIFITILWILTFIIPIIVITIFHLGLAVNTQ